MQFGASTSIWVSPFSSQALYLVEKIHSLGFDLVEFVIEEPGLIDIAAIQAALSRTGMRSIICSTFSAERDLSSPNPTIRDSGVEYLRQCVEVASALGAPLVCGPIARVSKGRRTARSREVRYRRLVDSLRDVAAYAAERDVKLAIEPLNRFETDMINTARQALSLVEAIGSASAGVHLDTFHMHIEEKSMAAAIRLTSERLFHIHASENDRGIPGTGQVDWRGFSRALKKIDYCGAIVINASASETLSDSHTSRGWQRPDPDHDSIAREGLKFLRKLFCSTPDGAEHDPGLAVCWPR